MAFRDLSEVFRAPSRDLSEALSLVAPNLNFLQILPLKTTKRTKMAGVTQAKAPQGPCHIKNATVILIHYGGGKKNTTAAKNTTAGSLKHLVSWGTFTGDLDRY